MKAHLLGCAGLLALCACAAHPSRCGNRLTPINRQPARPQMVSIARRGTAQAAKAGRQ